MRYFDAGALVKRYVREKGTVKVRRLLTSDLASTSRYSVVEISSALARRVREGVLTDSDRERTLAALQEDMTALLAVELTSEVVSRAQVLLRRHPLRAGDAVQLASCLHLQEALEDQITLVAFDERLLAAARKERVAVA